MKTYKQLILNKCIRASDGCVNFKCGQSIKVRETPAANYWNGVMTASFHTFCYSSYANILTFDRCRPIFPITGSVIE